jgi:hypothetical protein
MRVLVCGGRDFVGHKLMCSVMDKIYLNEGMTVLIEGEARGADRMSKWWAEAYDIEIEEYPAEWGKHGRKAGYLRNVRMLEQGKPDLVVAFPGGKGTAMMIELAEKAGVEVRKIDDS